MDKQILSHLYNEILLSNKKKRSTDTCNNMGESQKHLEWRNISTSMYCIIPLTWNSKTGKTNLEWWEANKWFCGSRLGRIDWKGTKIKMFCLVEVVITWVYMKCEKKYIECLNFLKIYFSKRYIAINSSQNAPPHFKQCAFYCNKFFI